MKFNFSIFDTGNAISLLALLVAAVSLFLNLSDRWQRRMNFRIADARAYTMNIDMVDSHVLLCFRLINVSSRPLSLDNLHIRLRGDVSLPVLSAIEYARLQQLVPPIPQANKLLVGLATTLPISVPAHGAVQIDALFCLKHIQHISDLAAFRYSPSSKPCIRYRIASRFLKEDHAFLDLVLSAHGRTRVCRFDRGSIAFFDPEDIDDALSIQ